MSQTAVIELPSCVEEQRQEAPTSADNNEPIQSSTRPVPLNRQTLLKLISAGFSFFFAGCNDGSLGVLIPYLLDFYNINTSFVSIVYATTFSGWFLAALSNAHLMRSWKLSTGNLLLLGALFQLLANALRVWAPPFPLYCISFFLTALGMGYQDAHSNTFVTTVQGAHRWLGFIHAMYAFGLLTGPFIATVIASHSRWNYFYGFTVGIGCLNLGLVLTAFDGLSFKRAQRTNSANSDAGADGNKQALQEIKATLKLPSVWFVSVYFFCFLGAGITVGGWVVEYLVRVRHGKLSQMGYVPSAFYGGSFLGRLLLAEPTFRFGERRMLTLYILLCLALQLIFWLVPNIVANVVVLGFMGFFFGPLFQTGISVGSKLFPAQSQAAALGFVFVIAQAGGSLFPLLTGVIATHAGVAVLQPILVGAFGATAISWLLVPKVPKPRE